MHNVKRKESFMRKKNIFFLILIVMFLLVYSPFTRESEESIRYVQRTTQLSQGCGFSDMIELALFEIVEEIVFLQLLLFEFINKKSAVKRCFWKFVLTFFLVCKHRIQTPRGCLIRSNICSVFA